MASPNNNNNYKSCPLKKRPIIYVKEEFQQREAAIFALAPVAAPIDDTPQDLSLKRKAPVATYEEYVVPAKRECALNLSKDADDEDARRYRSPIASPILHSSVIMSPLGHSVEDYSPLTPSDIHLRGLNAATAGYTTTASSSPINPYHTAFVMAAGCNPMTALWNSTPFQPTNSMTSIFPSPASSIASAVSPMHCYQQMTPPSSPSSEYACSEPEDLSVRNDIPLPALLHLFEEAPSRSQHSTSSSSASSAFMSLASSGHMMRNAASLSSPAHAAGEAAGGNAASKNYRFKCDKCTKMYSTSIGLSKHQQFHCPAAECNQEKKQHGCEECGKQYTTIGALKMHIRTHTLPCKCPICGKAFSRPWLLQGHIRTHTGEKPFQCADCPRSFADRSNLRAHQQTHVDVKKYACKICHKSFSRMSLLNKHVSSNCTITIA